MDPIDAKQILKGFEVHPRCSELGLVALTKQVANPEAVTKISVAKREFSDVKMTLKISQKVSQRISHSSRCEIKTIVLANGQVQQNLLNLAKKTKPLSLKVFRILRICHDHPWSCMISPVTLVTLVMTDAEMMENQVVFGFRGQTEARHRKCPRFHQGLHRRQHLGTAFLPSNGRNLRSLWLWLSGFDAYETLPEGLTFWNLQKVKQLFGWD